MMILAMRKKLSRLRDVGPPGAYGRARNTATPQHHNTWGTSVRNFAIAATVAALSTAVLAAPAQADPGPHDNTGYCISDGFYGNQPNMVDGHVVPSQSPGPKKTLPDGTVVQGNSIGDYNSGRVTGEKVNIPQACHAALG
jgi:hypothetical protein